MGRRNNKGLPIHGWLVVDKPLGLSSAKVVAQVKYATKAAKVGHGGTLDPLATGLLPIALGEATKTSAWAMDGSKTYTFVIRWGQATETDDGEGDIVEHSDVRPTADETEAALAHFTGDIEQMPPAYSALKIDGERAYKKARRGETVELKSRTVSIFGLKVLNYIDSDHTEFEAECGKGTYIRSLGRDLARHLGTVGHISVLRRTQVGPFEIKQAISLDKINDLSHNYALNSYLLPVETALADIPALPLTGPQAERLHHGQTVRVLDAPDGPCLAMNDGKPVALALVTEGEVQPQRVFNL
jgi:tRNA pseudouridine55 synthase